MRTQQEHTGRISNLTTKVHDLLITDTRYRDDDNLLVNRVQKDELANMGLNPANVTVYDFFRFRLNKQITDEDTITRARRKVQALLKLKLYLQLGLVIHQILIAVYIVLQKIGKRKRF